MRVRLSVCLFVVGLGEEKAEINVGKEGKAVKREFRRGEE